MIATILNDTVMSIVTFRSDLADFKHWDKDQNFLLTKDEILAWLKHQVVDTLS